MDLVRYNWSMADGNEFIKYLESFKRADKVSWTKNIINTDMKVLAIKSPEINMITREIRKGDYFSFLDLKLNEYYENVAINGKLISGIKDFDVMKNYLDEYVKIIDNWAACDILKFNIKKQEEDFFRLSEEYVKSNLPFVRRVGMFILFNFISYDEYIDRIFYMLNGFDEEEEYYVNMVNAWLMCELFIKRRDVTLEFFKENQLNKFTINKAISKCRDSFRVSCEDKELLLNYRR